MIAAVPVVKFNGTKNTFVLVDGRLTPLDNLPAFARRACNANSGLGVDGLLVVLPSDSADVRMRIINADGSEAEMCGNGARCVARYLDEHDGRSEVVLETLAGPIRSRVIERDPNYRVEVELNAPHVGAAREVAGMTAVSVDVGNPHAVIFVEDLAGVELEFLGRQVAREWPDPHGVNVHFAQITGDSGLTVLHWERGAGATQACGTGAVACAAAAIVTRGMASPVELSVPGGVLSVAWAAPNRAVMIGNAVKEFETIL